MGKDGKVMRALGCALLLGASGWFGLGAVWGLKARVDQLIAFLGALEEMERELSCRLTPMPELLGRLARTPGPVGEFFALCTDGLEHLGERSFASLWNKALCAADLSMDEDDLRPLSELGGSLGRYDCDSQCAAIGQARARLEVRLTDAQERRERLGRVYGALSLAAGTFLIILLL